MNTQNRYKRSIDLTLTNEDLKKLHLKAGGVGLTAAKLLEYFIADLIDGYGTNGSDERMYANEWFDRCWFSHTGSPSLLRYLIQQEEVAAFVALRKELEYMESLPEPSEDDQTDLEYLRGELAEFLNDYRRACGALEDSEAETEIQQVVEWYSHLEALDHA